MFTPPSSHSRSVIGLARLLMSVLISGDALMAKIEDAEEARDSFGDRLEVYFPNADQWPTETAEDGTVTRLEIDPMACARGEVVHARLKMDGVKVSRQVVLDAEADVFQVAALAVDALAEGPYIGKGGRFYPLRVFGEVDGEKTSWIHNQTHHELRHDLTEKLKAKGLKVGQVLADHGYKMA